MTASVFRSTPSMSVPLTQNTAPVLEFDCLYTHDSRKKQKKWQDGFLRYHTFNKRVMVYDVPRNFIGDMHWAGEDAVQGGDELTLERGGVMVQVGESIGQTETDLTELRKNKHKVTSAVHSQVPARAAQTPQLQPVSGNAARTNTQVKHKSLSALLGTPKCHVGRAQLPTRSSFEERHTNDEDEGWLADRPSKRPRIEVVTRIAPVLTPVKQAAAPLQPRTINSAKQQRKFDGLQRCSTKEVVNLLEDASHQTDFLPGFSDGILRNSSSPSRQRPVTTSDTLVKSSSPMIQVQQAGPVTRRIDLQKVVPTKAPIAKQVSPQIVDKPVVMAANALSRQWRSDASPRLSEDAAKARPTGKTDGDPRRPASSRSGQTLRLSSTIPKKRTLLCQDQVLKKPRRPASTNMDDAADSPLDVVHDTSRLESLSLTTSEKLQARLARIETKKQASLASSTSDCGKSMTAGKPAKAAATMLLDSDEDLPDGPPMGTEEEQHGSPAKRAQMSHKTSALELARLDRRMLPPAAPHPPKSAARPVPTSLNPLIALPPPPKEDRSLRRALSESGVVQSTKTDRLPGAPVRYTPSPIRTSRESTPVSGTACRPITRVPVAVCVSAPNKSKPSTPPHSPPDKPAYKKKGPLQKSVSLNMTSNGTSTVMLSKPFQAPGQAAAATLRWRKPERPRLLGPWSREAFDLFSWRPPGWDEDKWCIDSSAAKEGTAGTALRTSTNITPPPGLSGGAAPTSMPLFGRPVV